MTEYTLKNEAVKRCDGYAIIVKKARGDKNRNLAKTYLENKGELENLYRKSVDIIGQK